MRNMFDGNRKRSAPKIQEEFGRSRKRKQSSSANNVSHVTSQQQPMLTLPRVGHWCRDPYCHHRHHHHHHSHTNQDTTMSTLPNPKPEVTSIFRVESETIPSPGEFWNKNIVNSNEHVRSIFDASTLELPTNTLPIAKKRPTDTNPPKTNQTTLGYGFDHRMSTLNFTNQSHRQDGKDVGRYNRYKWPNEPEVHHNRSRKHSISSNANNVDSQHPPSQNDNVKLYQEFPKGYRDTNDGLNCVSSSSNGLIPSRFSFTPPTNSGSSSRQGSLINSRNARTAAALASMDENNAGDEFPDFSYVPPSMKLPTICTDCVVNVNGDNLANPRNFTRVDPQNTCWQPNYPNFPSTLRRDASSSSFISCGGFTLNGSSGRGQMKEHKMRRFCSSHKIALVVSTFSLLVTIGLVITLLLMKKKGMMEAM